MRFDVKKQENPNVKSYGRDELDIAYKFARRMYEEFGGILKAVVLFGSASRNEQKPSGDIDILVLVDDITIQLTAEVVETYRIIIEKAVAGISPRLHVTSLKLTSFWEYVRLGDPIAINILRDGVALVDTGIFDPLQGLLYGGRIRPTAESIYSYYYRAPKTLANSRWHITQAALDLYWAVIDSAHAALMRLGETPPTPEHVPDLIENRMVKQGAVDKKYADVARKFYLISKQIMRRSRTDITGQEFEQLYLEAKEFVEAMGKVINAQSGDKLAKRRA